MASCTNSTGQYGKRDSGPCGRRGAGPSGLLRPDMHHRLGQTGVQARGQREAR